MGCRRVVWSPETGGGEYLAMTSNRGKPPMDEGSTDVTLEELREFLEADRLGVRADPKFKERLRRKLWEIVRVRSDKPPRDEGDA